MKRVFCGVLIAMSLAAATSAQARLTDATEPRPVEDERIAVHLPTGCMARVILSGRTLVAATIIDEACLPAGVAARRIPGDLRDFSVLRGE